MAKKDREPFYIVSVGDWEQIAIYLEKALYERDVDLVKANIRMAHRLFSETWAPDED